MRPREPVEEGQADLFRARLDQISALDHTLERLARTVDWSFLERSFSIVYFDAPGRPPLPTRLMAGLPSTYTTRPMKRCARAGSTTRISSSFAARRSSGTICLSTDPH